MSPGDNFSFFLSALFKFIDFIKTSSKVNFLPVKLHSRAVLWGYFRKSAKMNSGKVTLGIFTSGIGDFIIVELCRAEDKFLRCRSKIMIFWREPEEILRMREYIVISERKR
uniref:Uncharacterized protein n=1 Tax=Photinus pyralis TaxID=7054 RepID=A0A1Y1NE86_PHOPY